MNLNIEPVLGQGTLLYYWVRFVAVVLPGGSVINAHILASIGLKGIGRIGRKRKELESQLAGK